MTDLTESEKKALAEYHAAVDEWRDDYLEKALGESEAYCVSQLADIVDNGGEKGEKAMALAKQIYDAYPEGDARHTGAEKVIDHGERMKLKNENADLHAEVAELKRQIQEMKNGMVQGGTHAEGGGASVGGGNAESPQQSHTQGSSEEGSGAEHPAAENPSAAGSGEEYADTEFTEYLHNNGFNADGTRNRDYREMKAREMASVMERFYKNKDLTDKDKANLSFLNDLLSKEFSRMKVEDDVGRQFDAMVGDKRIDEASKAYLTSLRNQAMKIAGEGGDTSKIMDKAIKGYYAARKFSQSMGGNGAVGGEGEEKDYGTGGYANISSSSPNIQRASTSILKDPPPSTTDTTYQRETAKDIESALQKEGVAIVEDTAAFTDGPSAFSLDFYYHEREDPSKIKAKFTTIAKRLGIKDYTFDETVNGKKTTVRITINKPNRRPASFKKLMENPDTERQTAKMAIPVLVGERMDGTPIWGDFIDHGLLGGTTGSGKTTGMNSGIASLMMARSPKQVRLIVNDAAKKGQTLGCWNGDPHLIGNVATSESEVVENLKKASDEMNRRARILAGKSIEQYNEEARARGGEELPYILMVTDEMTDLFANPTYGKEAASLVSAIVRKGRSLGVSHLGATQRPSSDNTPKDTLGNNRVCLKMKTPEESNMVINGYRGGDKLQMHGDGVTEIGGSRERIQSPLIDADDIASIVRHYSTNNGAAASRTSAPNQQPPQSSAQPQPSASDTRSSTETQRVVVPPELRQQRGPSRININRPEGA